MSERNPRLVADWPKLIFRVRPDERDRWLDRLHDSGRLKAQDVLRDLVRGFAEGVINLDKVRAELERIERRRAAGKPTD